MTGRSQTQDRAFVAARENPWTHDAYHKPVPAASSTTGPCARRRALDPRWIDHSTYDP